MRLLEKIKVVELEPTEEGRNGELDCTFIIEVFKEIGKEDEFFPRVYRREFFRIQPTFPQDPDGSPLHDPSDEEIIVVDVGEWEKYKGKTVDGVIEWVVNKLKSDYGINKEA